MRVETGVGGVCLGLVLAGVAEAQIIDDKGTGWKVSVIGHSAILGDPGAACDYWAARYPNAEIHAVIPFRPDHYKCAATYQGAPTLIGVTFACDHGIVSPFGNCSPNTYVVQSGLDLSSVCGARQAPADVGNPVNPLTGAKRESVVDFTTDGANPFQFTRNYHSLYAYDFGTLGRGWTSPLDRRLIWTGADADPMAVILEDGMNFSLKKNTSGVWAPERSLVSYRARVDWTGAVTEVSPSLVELRTMGGRVDQFERKFGDNNWVIVSSREPNGYQTTYTYGLNSKISKIEDSFGREFVLTWNVDNRGAAAALAEVTTPGGTRIVFSYDRTVVKGDPNTTSDDYGLPGSEKLTKVSLYAAGQSQPAKSTEYHYEDSRANSYYLLTGITDARGVRFATYAYDEYGRVVSSDHSGEESRTYSYDDANLITTATNPLGKVTRYHYTKRRGVLTIDRVEGVPSTYCLGADTTYTYDSNSLIQSVTDGEGRRTEYTNDANGLITRVVENAGSPGARTTEARWNVARRLPEEIIEPGLTTTFSYAYDGDRLTQVTRTETDTSGN